MTTYYIDASGGSDNNTGTSPSSAWASIEKVNQTTFKPGDTILFHGGDVYEATLIPSGSGTASNPITYGAYGNGPDPVFKGSEDVSDASWTKVGGNVWSVPVANEGSWDCENIWLDGKSGNPESSTLGGVDQPGDWYWNGGKLYVYSASDPASAFKSVEVNVRDYGIKINGVDYVHIENIEVTQARQNVLIQNSKGAELLNLEVHQSVRDGILLKEANDTLIQGGSSHDNGVDGTSDKNTHLGHGVLISTNAANNTVSGMKLYNNAEDGVQFGNSAGSGNKIIDNVIYGNREDGIDIKNGSHSFTGNEIYDNKENAILVHNTAGTQTLTNNILKTQDSGNPLDVSSGAKVISSGNWYEGVNSQTLHLQSSAANGCSFSNDTFVDGGASIKVSVAVQGGTGHTFDNSTFVMHNNGHAIKIEGSAKAAITDSIIYGHGGDLISSAANGVALDHNVYWDAKDGATWFTIGGSGKGSSWASGVDGRAIVADPRFIDCEGGDLSLKSGSPAAGCGSNATNVGGDAGGGDGTGGDTGGHTGGDTGGDGTGGDTGGHTGGDTGGDGTGGGGTDDGDTWTLPTIDGKTMTGTSGSDKLNGGSGNDLLEGVGGNDKLFGRGGDDVLVGGDGNDLLKGLNGDDWLFGQDGSDTLRGINGNDVLDGGAGDDQLWGGSGNDTFVFSAGSGKDVVRDFEPGKDKIDLGAWSGESLDSMVGRAVSAGGDTVLRFADGSQAVLKNVSLSSLNEGSFIFAGSTDEASNPDPQEPADPSPTDPVDPGTSVPTVPDHPGGAYNTVNGTAGADKIVGRGSNDEIDGRGGNDLLKGGAGDDLLFGGEGNDVLHGSGGNDVLSGGAGDDQLWGWAGSDTFVFAPDGGADRIKDFQPGVDHIDLTAFGMTDVQDLLAEAGNRGGNAILDLGDGSQVELVGVSLSELGSDDFVT